MNMRRNKRVGGWGRGRHSGAAVSLALTPHSDKVAGSIPEGLGPLCLEFACSLGVCVGSPRVLRVQKHPCANSNLTIRVWVNACLSLFVFL